MAATVTPNNVQKIYLDSLLAASISAATTIKSSCPAQTPMTVPERLEAAQVRLRSLQDAVLTVAPALTGFYQSLDEGQRVRFKQMGTQE
jgi:hypothetical protein